MISRLSSIICLIMIKQKAVYNGHKVDEIYNIRKGELRKQTSNEIDWYGL